MRKLIPWCILASLCALSFPGWAGDVLQSDFTGQQDDICAATNGPEGRYCYDGTMDASGNLLDLSGENLWVYSDQVNNWTGAPVNMTISADQMRDPDGLYRADVISETSAAGTNFRVSAINMMAVGTPYTNSIVMKPLNRSWVMIGWEGLTIYAYVDLKNLVVGNTVGSPTVDLRTLPGGWVEVSITRVALNNGGVYIFAAEANGDNTFDGLSQPSFAIARASLYKREAQWSTKRSPYLRTAGVAKPRLDLAPSPVTPTRTAELNYNRSGYLNWTKLGITAPTFEVDFSQDPSGATITANTGQILTKAGAPTRVTDGTWPATLTGAEGYAHTFVAATPDYYTSTIAPPAGSFSVACVVTPSSLVAGGRIIGSWTTIGALRGWLLRSNTNSVDLYVSDDGTLNGGHFSVATVGSVFYVGRPTVIAGAFEYIADGTSIIRVMADESGVSTISNSSGPVFAGSSNLSIAAESDGTTPQGGMYHHCIYWDGLALSEAQLRTVIRAWRGLVNPDGVTSIASATSPDVVLVNPATSATEPFIVPMPANTTQVGVNGMYSPGAITNLVTDPSLETWGASVSCGRCPTGLTCTCTAGDGTSAMTEDASTRANRTYSAKLSVTGTTSRASMNNPCLTTGIGSDLYGEIWAKAAGAGVSDFYFRINQYDTAACATFLQSDNFWAGALGATWDFKSGKVPAANWNAATSSYQIEILEIGNGGVDTWVDAPQVRVSPTATDAFCVGTCSTVIPSTPSMLTANGEGEIEITLQTPWAGTGVTGTKHVWCDGTPGAANTMRLAVNSSSDEVYAGIYDASGTEKALNPNTNNWAANTEYTLRFGADGNGNLGVTWPVGFWFTTTSGGGTGLRSAAQATTYIGAASTTGSDVWTKRVVMTTRGAPYTVKSPVQQTDGNQAGAIDFMQYNYFSRASHDSMNVFDQDHTLTIATVPTTRAYTGGVAFSKFDAGGAMAGNYLVVDTSTGQKTFVYYPGPAIVYGPNPGSSPGTLNIVQETRAWDASYGMDLSKLYDNGAGPSLGDVTGIDPGNAQALTLGQFNSGTNLYQGSIAYVRLDGVAKTEDELTYERQLLQGWAAGKAEQRWSFGRSTVATGKLGNLSVASWTKNSPRIGGPGGGILMENQATQLFRYSQAFGSWASINRMSVVADYANDYLAPDGTRTAQVFAEDGTAANSHYVRDSGKALTIGTNYTYSFYVRPVNRHHVYIAMDGVVSSANFDLSGSGTVGTMGGGAAGFIKPAANGFFRVWMTFTAGAASQAPYIYIAEADSDLTFDGLSQDSLVVWGAQLEAGKVPTSYIYSGASPNVVRTADGMSMTALQAGLPLSICPTCPAKKLKMSVDIKCRNRLPSTPATQAYIATIGGAASASNQSQFYFSSTGRYYFSFTDSVGTSHSVYSTIDMVNCDDWVHLEGSYDTTDLSTLSFTVNGSSTGMTYTNNTGTATFDLAGLSVFFGNRTGSALNNCWHRNLRIGVE